jgi:hypothetical protein
LSASTSSGQVRESMAGGELGMSSTTKGSLGNSLRNSSISRADNKSFERAQNFEEAFNKIFSATGITDIEELVTTFIKNEDHNFSLFNYVNEQNNEIEKLEEQIQSLRDEEQKYAMESGDNFQEHKQVLNELEDKLQTTDSMAEKYEIRCQDLQRVIESLKRGIQSIYEKFEANEEEKERGFGEAVVTESNMVHYLGLIEQRANLILQSFAEEKHSTAGGVGSKGTSDFFLSTPAESGSPAESSSEELPSTVSNVALGAHNMSLNLNSAASAPKSAGAVRAEFSFTSVLGTGPKVPMGQELIHVSCFTILSVTNLSYLTLL